MIHNKLFQKTVQILFIPFFLFNCSSSDTENTEKEEKIINEQSQVTEYSIINKEHDDALSKITINVQLNHEVNEAKLKEFANEIKISNSNYDKLWIFYFLPDMIVGEGAWAISHYKPSLELEILGASKSSTDQMNITNISGEIISTWIDNDAIAPNTKYLVNENDKLIMKSVYAKTKYSNATVIEEELTKTKQDGLTRYNYQNNHEECYLIESNGNLSIYDSEGKFKELNKK